MVKQEETEFLPPMPAAGLDPAWAALRATATGRRMNGSNVGAILNQARF